MKTKKVNRYWCDFCNKAGLQARAMETHEAHCTMNPNRSCRVCLIVENWREADEVDTLPLPDLIAMLPDPTAYNQNDCGSGIDQHSILMKAMEEILPAFRKATGNCPACMMAALRLRKIPVPMVEQFNFKVEMQEIFVRRNQERRDDGCYGY